MEWLKVAFGDWRAALKEGKSPDRLLGQWEVIDHLAAHYTYQEEDPFSHVRKPT